MAATPRIDAHQHFWTLTGGFDHRWLEPPEMEPIRRDFLPPDLASELKAANVDGTVVVQTQHALRENDWAFMLADQHPFIRGVVGWVDLRDERLEEHVLALKAHPRFAGVRHLVHDETDPEWIVRPKTLRGLAVLEKRDVPLDLLMRPEHLKHVPVLARKFPRLRMVIDHLAKPRIRKGLLEPWLADFKRAAAFTNVCCKLSGMVTEAAWSEWAPEHLQPYVQAALGAFGPDRLMFGSDWPVCLLAASYQRVVEALDHSVRAFPSAAQARIWGGTAAEFYRLKFPAS